MYQILVPTQIYQHVSQTILPETFGKKMNSGFQFGQTLDSCSFTFPFPHSTATPSQRILFLNQPFFKKKYEL